MKERENEISMVNRKSEATQKVDRADAGPV